MFKVFEVTDFYIRSSTLRALAPSSFLTDFSRCLLLLLLLFESTRYCENLVCGKNFAIRTQRCFFCLEFFPKRSKLLPFWHTIGLRFLTDFPSGTKEM